LLNEKLSYELAADDVSLLQKVDSNAQNSLSSKIGYFLVQKGPSGLNFEIVLIKVVNGQGIELKSTTLSLDAANIYDIPCLKLKYIGDTVSIKGVNKFTRNWSQTAEKRVFYLFVTAQNTCTKEYTIPVFSFDYAALKLTADEDPNLILKSDYDITFVDLSISKSQFCPVGI
jgi:hypothetical protein